MTSTNRTIAGAVAAALNATLWTETFSAVVSRAPMYDLEAGDLNRLQVSVIPAGHTSEPANRIATLQTHVVVIGVAKRTAVDDIDALDCLLDAIEAFCLNRDFDGYLCYATEVAPPEAASLREDAVYKAAITLRFKVHR